MLTPKSPRPTSPTHQRPQPLIATRLSHPIWPVPPKNTLFSHRVSIDQQPPPPRHDTTTTTRHHPNHHNTLTPETARNASHVHPRRPRRPHRHRQRPHLHPQEDARRPGDQVGAPGALLARRQVVAAPHRAAEPVRGAVGEEGDCCSQYVFSLSGGVVRVVGGC